MKSALTFKSASIKRELFVLGIIAVIALTLRLSFLHEPIERDEGGYAYIGQEILRGSIPYKDVIDLKPPGIYYLYACAILLFGNTTESIRIFTAIYSLITLVSVYLLARYSYGIVAGIFAALLYSLYSCAPLTEGSGSNTEVFMILPLVVGAILVLKAKETQSRVFLLGSGIFAGMAMLIKTVALPYAVLLFASSFYIKGPDVRLKEKVLDIFSFAASLLFMAGLTISFFYYKGALSEFIYWNVSLPIMYSQGGVVKANSFLDAIRNLSPELLLPSIIAFPTAVWLVVAEREFKNILLALLLLASCLGVWMPGKFFHHYFIQLLPFLATLAGIGLALLLERKSALLYVASPIIAASFFYYFCTDYKYFFNLPAEKVSIDKFGNYFADSVYIADYIKKRTIPSDYIFQLGFEPEIYFLTDRRSPVPYISTPIIKCEKNPWLASLLTIRTIKKVRPKYIVVQKEWANIHFVERLEKFLDANYDVETHLKYAEILKRRSI